MKLGCLGVGLYKVCVKADIAGNRLDVCWTAGAMKVTPTRSHQRNSCSGRAMAGGKLCETRSTS